MRSWYPNIHLCSYYVCSRHFYILKNEISRQGRYWIGMKRTIIFLFLAVHFATQPREQEKVQPILEGHLALPTSQQTSPIFCFGQNIVDKGDKQAFAFLNSFIGKNNNFTDIIPNFFYGIRDNFSVIVGIPIVANCTSPSQACLKQGFDAIFMQFEYAFYNDDHTTYANQMTFVANAFAPLRSNNTCDGNRAVVTGPASLAFANLDSPSCFLGMTASHMATDWYYFISSGGVIPLEFHGRKGDSQFLYQGGISRNIYYIPNQLIISGLLELFGTLSKPNITSSRDKQSCSLNNSFYIGPSFWIATEKFIFNFGIAFPVTKQKGPAKNRFLFALETGWKFS
jgi:hypothetical protein